MLTVWAVCVGSGYSHDDVRILRNQVSRNLKLPHKFIALTDRPIEGVECLMPDEIWPGWFSKLLIFRHGTVGRNLYIDLDCVVTGDLEPLLSDTISAPANWAQSGHGGVQSSVMAWSGDWSFIADSFNPSLLRDDIRHPFGRYGNTDYWGDQGFLTGLLGSPGDGKIEPMAGVYSYRYHCAAGRFPADASIVAFHGRPKASEVSDQWVIDARSSTAIAA